MPIPAAVEPLKAFVPIVQLRWLEVIGIEVHVAAITTGFEMVRVHEIVPQSLNRRFIGWACAGETHG